MSRRCKILLVLLLPPVILAAVAFGIPGIRSKILGYMRGEPFYDGQPASVWGRDLESEADAGKKGPASENLKRGGKKAMPVLIELGARGPAKAQPLAREIMVQLGDAAVPALTTALRRSSTAERRMAVVLLGELGAKAQPAVKVLAEMINDADVEVKATVLPALEKIGAPSVEALPYVIKVLEGQDKVKIVQAARVVGRIGPPAKDAAPALIKTLEVALEDHSAIIDALASVRDPAVAPLMKILETHADPVVRARAANVFSKMTPPIKESVPALAACLSSGHAGLIREACLALAYVGKDAAPAAPALIAVLENKSAPMRAYAAQAVGQIGPDAKDAVPVLMAILGEPKDEALFEKVGIALGKMGPDAEPAVPLLLATFGPKAPIKEIGLAAIPRLIKLLPTEQGELNADAVGFLDSFPKNEVVPGVRAELIEGNRRVRLAAVRFLTPERCEPGEVVPALLDTLGDDDERIQQTARQNLAAFGKAALPYLDTALRGQHVSLRGKDEAAPGESEALRLEAARLIHALGVDARTSAGTLLVVLKEEDRGIAQADANRARETRDQAQADLDKAKKEKDAAAEKLAVESLRKSAAELKDAEKRLERVQKLHITVVRALAIMDHHPGEAIPVLHTALKNRDDPVLTIAQIGRQGRWAKGAKDGVPLLGEFMKEKDARVRLAVVEALGKMGLDRENMLPAALLEGIKDEDAGVREASVRSLKPRKFAAQTVPALLGALNDADDKVQAAAIETLGKIGAPARAAVPQLVSIAKEKPTMRERCVIALGRIGPDAREAGPLLLTLLEEKSADAPAVIEALGRIKVTEAVPRLKPLVKREEGRVAVAAALALWRMDRSSESAPPFLREQVKDKELAEYAVTALGYLGTAAGDAGRKMIVDILKNHSDMHMRAVAAEALGNMKTDARDAIDTLIRSLDRRFSQEVRISAARALAQLDQDAMSGETKDLYLGSSGLLRAMLEDPESPLVRQAAIEGLIIIDPPALAEYGLR